MRRWCPSVRRAPRHHGIEKRRSRSSSFSLLCACEQHIHGTTSSGEVVLVTRPARTRNCPTFRRGSTFHTRHADRSLGEAEAAERSAEMELVLKRRKSRTLFTVSKTDPRGQCCNGILALGLFYLIRRKSNDAFEESWLSQKRCSRLLGKASSTSPDESPRSTETTADATEV